MNRKQRTYILCHSPLEEVLSLSKKIEDKYVVKLIEAPNSGLVMIKMRDAAHLEKFFLGEVFVTECKVMIEDKIGLGIVSGIQEARSEAMAIIDGAYRANLSILPEIKCVLTRLEDQIKRIQKRAGQQLLKTKVDFDTLYEEVKS